MQVPGVFSKLHDQSQLNSLRRCARRAEGPVSGQAV